MQKKKKLIIAVICLVVVLIALIVVLVILNNKSDEKKDEPVHTNGKEESSSGSSIEKIDNDEGLKVTVTPTEEVTTVPTMELQEEVVSGIGEYKGLETEYKPKTITDEDIKALLDQIQEENSEWVNLPSRPFKAGDMAIVTYEGRIDGKRIDEFYAVCLQVILGKGMLTEKIENELIGGKIGERFFIDLDYPADYTTVPEAAGKTVNFELYLVDGFEYYVPEVDDELIRTVTGYQSLSEFKQKEIVRLQEEENEKAHQETLNILKQKLIDICSYTDRINDEIKKAYVLRISEENKTYNDSYMMDAATYYNLMYEMSAEDYQKMIMDEVTIDTKYRFALSEVAKRENITIEEAEKLIVDSAVIKGMEE